MLAVLDFDPVLLPASAIWPIAVLRDQTLKAKFAGRLAILTSLSESVILVI
jgi:hypothetical protein